MIENLFYTDNNDYINSFKSLANKIKLRDIFSKEFEDKDQEKAIRVLEIKNLLRQISYRK